MEASIFVTYRCNAKCSMCNTWKYPSKQEEEITLEIIDKLPTNFSFINVAGGEPFIREDIEEIVSLLRKKSKRIVISTNGYFTDRIVELVSKFPDVGIRISVEGFPAMNDDIRGIKDGFDHVLRTLLQLRDIGAKDIGCAITISDKNVNSLLEMYNLMKSMNMQFATSSVHNSFYFHKDDNSIIDKELVAKEFEKLSRKMLKSNAPKEWFRAYFNYGMAYKIRNNKRLFPCTVGTDSFRLNPFGKIIPCEGMNSEMEMGDLKTQTFEEIWNSKKAEEVRNCVKNCSNNCWMIGTVSPIMKKHIGRPLKWIIKNKVLKLNTQ